MVIVLVTALVSLPSPCAGRPPQRRQRVETPAHCAVALWPSLDRHHPHPPSPPPLSCRGKLGHPARPGVVRDGSVAYPPGAGPYKLTVHFVAWRKGTEAGISAEQTRPLAARYIARWIGESPTFSHTSAGVKKKVLKHSLQK